MSHSVAPVENTDGRRRRSGLIGILLAAGVGAALAIVAVVGTTSAVASDGPGKATQELVSYDQ